MRGVPAKDLDYVLNMTKELWDELRGQRLFVTGGTGFLGSWLLESFCWVNDRLGLNAEAVVLTRNLDAFERKAPHLAAHPAIQFEIGDVRSFSFPPGEFSHVVHAAAESSLQASGQDPFLILDTIVDGTRRTLEFARRSGTKKLMLISSGAVYGRQPRGIAFIQEDWENAPDTSQPRFVYGHAKRLSEHLCALYADHFGIQTMIARCFAFVGPYLPLDASFAISNFIRDGLKGGPIRVKGNGTQYRSYLYAADLAIWLWTILFKGKSCFPYNVGSDEAISIADLANLVANQFEPRPRIEIERNQVHGLAGERYSPSIERVRREFGLRPTIGLAEAVQRTTDWFRCVAGGSEQN